MEILLQFLHIYIYRIKLDKNVDKVDTPNEKNSIIKQVSLEIKFCESFNLCIKNINFKLSVRQNNAGLILNVVK